MPKKKSKFADRAESVAAYCQSRSDGASVSVIQLKMFFNCSVEEAAAVYNTGRMNGDWHGSHKVSAVSSLGEKAAIQARLQNASKDMANEILRNFKNMK
ncbi:MAG: hypothetical protein ACR2NF_03245 [Pirellulales bacterium]